MIALDHTGADPGLLPQLERRLEQIVVKTHRVINTNERCRRLCTDESPVAYQTSDDDAVLLLDPSLIILPIGAVTGYFQS